MLELAAALNPHPTLSLAKGEAKPSPITDHHSLKDRRPPSERSVQLSTINSVKERGSNGALRSQLRTLFQPPAV